MSLKKMRNKAKLSQSQLAVQSRVSLYTIRAYEQGKRSLEDASYRTLKTLANVLGCQISDIVD